MEGVVSLAVQDIRAGAVSMADMILSFLSLRRGRDAARPFRRPVSTKQNFPCRLPNLPQYFSISMP